MRAIFAAVAVTAVVLLGAGSAGAQPALTTCALTGVYALSAALAFQGPAQLSGQFAFTPPPSCVAGAVGTAQVQLSALFAGNPTPTVFATSLPYSVDPSGGVTIGTGVIRGNLGGIAATGIANSLVFAADPAITPATIRFAGTALRVGLAPDVAVYDAHGTQVGRLLNITSFNSRTVDVLLQVNGQTFRATVSRTRFTASDSFLGNGSFFFPPAFQSTDCTGSALIPTGTSSDLLPVVGIPGGFTAYLPDRSGVVVTLSIQSYRDQNNVCQPIASSMVAVSPALPPINLGALFVPPFTLQ